MWFLERLSGILVSFSSIDFLSLTQLELKLTKIALDRSQNHIGERKTDKGVQVGIFLLKIRWYF